MLLKAIFKAVSLAALFATAAAVVRPAQDSSLDTRDADMYG